MWIRPPAGPPAQTTRFLKVLVSVYEGIPEKSFRLRNEDNKGYRVSSYSRPQSFCATLPAKRSPIQSIVVVAVR